MGDHASVPVFYQGMDDALWMDQDIDCRFGQIEQPTGFDHFQRLVHHCRGIDRDFFPHRPVGVPKGQLGCDPCQFFFGGVEKGSARPDSSRESAASGPETRRTSCQQMVCVMRQSFLVAFLLALAPAIQAQDAAVPMRLSVDEAVNLALQNNLELAAVRIDPQIGDTRVAAASGLFRPTFTSNLQRNSQLQPPANLLQPIVTRTDVVTSNVGFNQRLPWFGTSYNVAWDTSHTDSEQRPHQLNPLLRSGLTLSVSQPLLSDLSIDPCAGATAVNGSIAAICRHARAGEGRPTTAAVKSAYWELSPPGPTWRPGRPALRLAEELVRVNTRQGRRRPVAAHRPRVGRG